MCIRDRCRALTCCSEASARPSRQLSATPAAAGPPAAPGLGLGLGEVGVRVGPGLGLGEVGVRVGLGLGLGLGLGEGSVRVGCPIDVRDLLGGVDLRDLLAGVVVGGLGRVLGGLGVGAVLADLVLALGLRLGAVDLLDVRDERGLAHVSRVVLVRLEVTLGGRFRLRVVPLLVVLGRCVDRRDETCLGVLYPVEGGPRRHRLVAEQAAQLVEVGGDGLALTVEVFDLPLRRRALALGLDHGLGQGLLGVLAGLGDHPVGVAPGVGQEVLGMRLGVLPHLLGLLECAGHPLLGLGGVRLGVAHQTFGLLPGLLVALGVGPLGGLVPLGDLHLRVGKRSACVIERPVDLGLGLGGHLGGPAPRLGDQAFEVQAHPVALLVGLAFRRRPELGTNE